LKFGIQYNSAYYGVDPDVIAGYAKHAEDCGFESIFIPEHVVLYPGATLGTVPIDPSLPLLDPLACLSFIAAATERIILGTAVLQLPYHHPVTLAKRVATIDVLSKGRMRLLTIGLGSLRGESDALGIDHATLGAQVLAKQGLPRTITDAVQEHHVVGADASPLTRVVHVADCIAKIIEGDSELDLDATLRASGVPGTSDSLVDQSETDRRALLRFLADFLAPRTGVR